MDGLSIKEKELAQDMEQNKSRGYGADDPG